MFGWELMKKKEFRLLVAGGGTGGHITPGLAVIESLRKRPIHLRLLWVGVTNRQEADIVPRYNIPLQCMSLKGLNRSIAPRAVYQNSKSAINWLLLRPIMKSIKIIKDFEPDFILGTGGYVCAPIIVAGWLLGKPRWLLEQNSVPGLTVRMLSRFVDTVGIAYDSSRDLLPNSANIQLVGNPVMSKTLSMTREDGMEKFKLDPNKRTLLVIGGSLGSAALNNAVWELLSSFYDKSFMNQWQIIHSIGKGKYKNMDVTFQKFERYKPYPFLYEPEYAMAAADLVLCRAGAMTLAEITAKGLTSIIVPWPGAVRNHQYTNAQAMVSSGAAMMITEDSLGGYSLAETLKKLTNSKDKLDHMSQQSQAIGHPGAADNLADKILGSVSDD